MLPVNKFSSRYGERVRCVTLHTSEGARDVYSLAAFLNRPGVNASYHGAVDDQRYEAYVNYSNAAWALRNGNQESDNLCLCAFAGWSRAEWLRHPRMLELTAAWIAERCLARRVPITLLTARQTGDAIRNDNHPGGVCDHDRYTKGTGDGSHWDVGPNFPWDVVMGRAQQLARPEDIMASLDDLRRVVWETVPRIVREQAMDVRIPREGAGTSGETSPRAVTAWTDSAWVKQRQAVDELGQRVAALSDQVTAQQATLDAILEVVGGPKA